MTQLNEAVARYHRMLESDAFKDLTWVDALQEKLRTHHLNTGGQRVSPVLRPHFLTQRQYTNLVRAAETLYLAMDRVEKMALASPQLMARISMLPAEKMLAAVDPGYSFLSVTSLLDTHLSNGTLSFVGCTADAPSGVLYGETLNSLFYDALPVREFRKKFPLARPTGTKPVLQSLLRAWKEFGGQSQPRVAILEMRQPYQTADSGECALLCELFRQAGYAAETVLPEHLEYRNGILRRGQFEIDVVYRRIRVSEFLMRYDLNHPLMRAYRERKVCVVNSFRSEITQKKALFELLTDDSVTASFPVTEKKAIREFIPWTRVVAATSTVYHDMPVDLPSFIHGNRERLVLKPNDDDGERQTFVGSELDESGWDRAIRTAMRGSYVVQEVTKPLTCSFPLHRYGSVEMKNMTVDVHPHAYLGKVSGCSAWLTPATSNGFSTVAGLAPAFILESK